MEFAYDFGSLNGIALKRKVIKERFFRIPESFFEFQDTLCEPVQTILRLGSIGQCPLVLGI